MLTLQYDSTIDALYIYISGVIADGEAAKQVPLDFYNAELGGLILDLSDGNQLLGVEVLDAARRLAGPIRGVFDSGAARGKVETAEDSFRITFGGRGRREIRVSDPSLGIELRVGVDEHASIASLTFSAASRLLRSERPTPS